MEAYLIDVPSDVNELKKTIDLAKGTLKETEAIY
jgi:hypothetical protein